MKKIDSSKKKSLEKEIYKLETTLGELISIVTEIAFESVKDERKSYTIASKAVEKILKNRICDRNIGVLKSLIDDN
jgi:predicted RNA-binding protein